MTEYAAAWIALLSSTCGLLLGVFALGMGYRRTSSLAHFAWVAITIGLIGIPFGIANVLRLWP